MADNMADNVGVDTEDNGPQRGKDSLKNKPHFVCDTREYITCIVIDSDDTRKYIVVIDSDDISDDTREWGWVGVQEVILVTSSRSDRGDILVTSSRSDRGDILVTSSRSDRGDFGRVLEDDNGEDDLQQLQKEQASRHQPGVEQVVLDDVLELVVAALCVRATGQRSRTTIVGDTLQATAVEVVVDEVHGELEGVCVCLHVRHGDLSYQVVLDFLMERRVFGQEKAEEGNLDDHDDDKSDGKHNKQHATTCAAGSAAPQEGKNEEKDAEDEQSHAYLVQKREVLQVVGATHDLKLATSHAADGIADRVVDRAQDFAREEEQDGPACRERQSYQQEHEVNDDQGDLEAAGEHDGGSDVTSGTQDGGDFLSGYRQQGNWLLSQVTKPSKKISARGLWKDKTILGRSRQKQLHLCAAVTN
ncbi:uncharacterized protein LOC118477560 [Aplysia californica]|uniref:Uncharacterized protein LOC118477560 n=1 Tax=Aplysia californica TaxID=6500 RepID=A0ABM1VS19_APLCA|nr:uncharacterized protein LOC118477560 [Aplysia californica]